MVRVVEVFVAAALAAGLWVLTLSAFPKDDLALAMGCGLVIGLTATLSRQAIRGDWQPKMRWVTWLGAVGGGVFIDTAKVFAAAGRRLLGRSSDVNESELRLPADQRANMRRARSALGVIAVSATPATVVIDADESARLIRVHHLGHGQELVERAVTSQG